MIKSDLREGDEVEFSLHTSVGDTTIIERSGKVTAIHDKFIQLDDGGPYVADILVITCERIR